MEVRKVGKSKYIFGFLLFGVVSLFADTNRYDVKSAIVEYAIVGSGDVDRKSVV